MEQPKGFNVAGQEKNVYQLKKALYGLKHVSRTLYSRIDAYLENLGFERSLTESTLYIKEVDAKVLVVPLYIDDLLITGSNKELIDKFKEKMMAIFEMTNLGRMIYFLGMQIFQKQNEIFLCHHKYTKVTQEIKHGRVQAYCNSNESEGEVL
jgi:hypothetical protein